MIFPRYIWPFAFAGFVAIIGGVTIWAAYVLPYRNSSVRCLTENEEAMYFSSESDEEEDSVTVVAKDKRTAATTTSFTTDIVQAEHYHPIELHTCGAYFSRAINYDFDKRASQAGYKVEIWRLDYYGKAEALVTLSENITGLQKDYSRYYMNDFRVDSSETYIALERGYAGQPDYALVIKEVETGEDVFVLTMNDARTKNAKVSGSFGLGKWVTLSDGDTYLWGDFFEGAYSSGYFRIKRGTWEVDIWPTPENFPSGAERSSTPTGYFAYADVTTFTGFQQITDQLLDEAIAAGKQKNLIVANLRTGEKTIVETVPIIKGHRFNLTWLSESELQYTMPDGEVRTYRVR